MAKKSAAPKPAAAPNTPPQRQDAHPAGADAGGADGITHLMVTCQREGFRRAGVAWTTLKRVVKVGDFTPEQIAALKAEPMLTVVEMTAADYQALIDELAS